MGGSGMLKLVILYGVYGSEIQTFDIWKRYPKKGVFFLVPSNLSRNVMMLLKDKSIWEFLGIGGDRENGKLPI